MTRFIDSHAHLADPAFSSDVDEVISRARISGASGIVCIGESLDSADRAALISLKNPGFVWYTVGVHPHHADSFDEDRDIPAIRAHVAAGAVAVGECGLDYHYDNSPRDAQITALSAQLAVAAELARPAIVHTREAEADTGLLIRESGARGVLHCFTGPRALAELALDRGWYVSFSGLVTFKSWKDDDLIRSIPDDQLLVESDSPYLAPVPNRGRRNEPAYVSLTVAHLARARGITAESLGSLVTDNALRCFGLATSVPPT